jgi:hypothetical protein
MNLALIASSLVVMRPVIERISKVFPRWRSSAFPATLYTPPDRWSSSRYAKMDREQDRTIINVTTDILLETRNVELT